MEAKDTSLHIINVPIGIGKSTAVLDHMKNTDKSNLIVLPNNDLKNELYEKAVSRGIRAVKSPSLIEEKNKLPTSIWNHIQSLYQEGKPHAVSYYIKEIITKGEADKHCLDIL